MPANLLGERDVPPLWLNIATIILCGAGLLSLIYWLTRLAVMVMGI